MGDFHAYAWIGSAHEKEQEALRKPPTELMERERTATLEEFRRSPLAPLRTCDWLLKPASMIKESFNAPDDAVSWLAGCYDRVQPSFAYPNQEAQIGRDFRLELAADMLNHRIDVAWGIWLSGGRFTTIALICCPNRHAPYPCPLTGQVSAKYA